MGFENYRLGADRVGCGTGEYMVKRSGLGTRDFAAYVEIARGPPR